MKYVIVLAVTSLLLSSCVHTGSSAPPKIDALITPDVPEYTIEQQEQAATEMEAGLSPMLNLFMNDYGVMRDQARVARPQ